MGFGILFIGYIFTVFDTGAMFSDSLGYLFMLALLTFGRAITSVGCHKLSRYIPDHVRAFYCSACLSVTSAIRLVCYAILKYGTDSYGIIPSFIFGVNVLSAVLTGIFFWYLLSGLYKICKQTELPSHAKTTMRLRASCVVFSVLDILSCFNLGQATVSLTSVRFLYYVILVGAVSLLIFRCYMRICLPEDVDMK